MGFIEYVIGKGESGRPDNAPCEANALFAILGTYSPVPLDGLFGEDENEADRNATGTGGGAGPNEGGDGGPATANGCNRDEETAGNGTDGHDGCTASCPYDPNDPEHSWVSKNGQDGKPGDEGVHGGNGTAHGGPGGPGLLKGGRGGDATATGGEGGKGGAGGNGGDAVPGEPCAKGGNGGKGGTGGHGGNSIARGGKGGNATLAAPVGQPGEGGQGFGKGGVQGEGGDGGEGGQGGFDFGVDVEAGSVSCAADDGQRGPKGDFGGSGQEAWESGAQGSTGTMTLYDFIEEETGVDVEQTVAECSTYDLGSVRMRAGSVLGCEAVYALVAAIEQEVQGCVDEVPVSATAEAAADSESPCGPAYEALAAAVDGVAPTVMEAAAFALECVFDVLPGTSASSTQSSAVGVECGAVGTLVQECLNGVEPTCRSVLDLATKCAPEASSAGSTPCGQLHELVVVVTGVVAECADGHDPANPRTNACSLAHACVQSLAACSGADDYLRVACGEDPDTQACIDTATTLALDLVQAVLRLVPSLCSQHDGEGDCVDEAGAIVEEFLTTVSLACEDEEGTDRCRAAITTVAWRVVDLAGGVITAVVSVCEAITTDAHASAVREPYDNPCIAKALELLEVQAPKGPIHFETTGKADGLVAALLRDYIHAN